MTKILALDYGHKRTGVAVSDALGITAQARPTICTTSMKALWLALENIIVQDEISKIIIGLPINMNGSKGPMSLEVERFAELVRQRTEIPVEFWDERLTSHIAERAMIQGQTRRDKRKKKIDQLAAILLLQSYLDAHYPG